MKYFIIILCLLFNLNAQITGYSFYGLGEDISGYHAASAGLGGAQFISGNHLDYSINSISSIWRSNLTKIYFSNSMGFANINSQKFNNHILAYENCYSKYNRCQSNYRKIKNNLLVK